MSLKTFKYCILTLSAIYGLFIILNIWYDICSPDFFWKISLTVGVIYVFLGIYYLLMHQETDKKLEDKGYMSK